MGADRISKSKRQAKIKWEVVVKSQFGNSGFVHSMWIGKIGNPILLSAINELGADAQLALYLKFWKREASSQIAKKLKMTEHHLAVLLRGTLESLAAVPGLRGHIRGGRNAAA